MPAAVEALRDFLLGANTDVAAWIELHTELPAILERTARLRAAAALLGARANQVLAKKP
jgi:hypothetical protein